MVSGRIVILAHGVLTDQQRVLSKADGQGSTSSDTVCDISYRLLQLVRVTREFLYFALQLGNAVGIGSVAK